MAQAQLRAVPPRRRRPEPEPESEFKLAEPLAQEIIGIACLIVAGLCLPSIFPAESLLSRTMGPAIPQALCPPGGVLLALGLAGLGVGFFWQGRSEGPGGSWQGVGGAVLVLGGCCALS